MSAVNGNPGREFRSQRAAVDVAPGPVVQRLRRCGYPFGAHGRRRGVGWL